MRLLYCPNCGDVFKLVRYGERSCLCGKVKGKLTDNAHAILNGEGFCLMLANIPLLKACKNLTLMDQNQPLDYYKENLVVNLYVHPHSGYGNPRSEIVQNDTEDSEAEPLSPDKAAYRDSQST